MKKYTLKLEEHTAVLTCSDGREESFPINGPTDHRIKQAKAICLMMGCPITLTPPNTPAPAPPPPPSALVS